MRLKFFFLAIFFTFFLGVLPARAFEISPIKMLITADAATTQTVVLKIKNTAATDANFLLSVLGMKQENNGLPVFARSVSPAEAWVYPETNRILIKAGETKSANFIIKIPSDSAAGSYYLGIAAESENANTSESSLNTRLVSLLTLQVSGLATETVVIDTWEKVKETDNAAWKFNLHLQNTGSVEVAMQGVAVIRNFKGENIFAEPITVGNKLLAGSKRALAPEISLNNRLKVPGLYQAQVKLHYGKTNQEVSALTYVWYVPLWSKISLIAAVAVLLLIVGLRLRKEFT